jgi:hypothetical protein
LPTPGPRVTDLGVDAMTRPLPALKKRSRAAKIAAKRGAFLSLRALGALLVVFLQLSSALHFTLVPHSYSAALGGLVHVHGEAAAQPHARVFGAEAYGQHAQTLVAGTLSCGADRCPFADAPHISVPQFASSVSGVASFGAARSLSAAEARSPSARRVFSTAPKTSPPVC